LVVVALIHQMPMISFWKIAELFSFFKNKYVYIILYT
jgi:hypothetical protein